MKYVFELKYGWPKSEQDLSGETNNLKLFELFEISHSVEGYDKKNCQKLLKLQQYRKTHSFQTVKDFDHKFWKETLKTLINIVSKFQVPIYNTVRDISRQRASLSGRTGSLQKWIHDIKIRKLILIRNLFDYFKDFMRCRRFPYIQVEAASLHSY